MPLWTPPPAGFDPLNPGLGLCSQCSRPVHVVMFGGGTVVWDPPASGVRWCCEACIIHQTTHCGSPDKLMVDTLLELAEEGHIVYWALELEGMKERWLAREIALRSPFVRSTIVGNNKWTQAMVDQYLPLRTPTATPHPTAPPKAAIIPAKAVAMSRRDPHNAEGTRGVDNRRDDIFREMFG